jgi:hypothetical protein
VNPEYVEKFELPASPEEMAGGKVNKGAANIGKARGWSSAKSRCVRSRISSHAAALADQGDEQVSVTVQEEPKHIFLSP